VELGGSGAATGYAVGRGHRAACAVGAAVRDGLQDEVAVNVAHRAREILGALRSAHDHGEGGLIGEAGVAHLVVVPQLRAVAHRDGVRGTHVVGVVAGALLQTVDPGVGRQARPREGHDAVALALPLCRSDVVDLHGRRAVRGGLRRGVVGGRHRSRLRVLGRGGRRGRVGRRHRDRHRRRGRALVGGAAGAEADDQGRAQEHCDERIGLALSHLISFDLRVTE